MRTFGSSFTNAHEKIRGMAGMPVCTCNPGVLEVEAGESEFKASVIHTASSKPV